MTSQKGNRSAYDGARIVTWLATKPLEPFETGEFWAMEETVMKEVF